MGTWIFGVVMAVVSLVGLFLASRAEDEVFRMSGYAFFAFGLIVIFYLIHKNTGHPPAEERHPTSDALDAPQQARTSRGAG